MFTEANNILLYSVKNSYSYSLISESVSIEKLLEAMHSWGYKFPQNTNFHLKASILSLATRSADCHASESSTLLIFGEDACQVPKFE